MNKQLLAALKGGNARLSSGRIIVGKRRYAPKPPHHPEGAAPKAKRTGLRTIVCDESWILP